MDIPNAWTPSTFARRIQYDAEGRLKSFNISRTQEGGIGDANSLYATDAERFDSITPFLKKNKAADVHAKGYTIQPGGACIYFDEHPELEDAYGGGKVQYSAPDPHEQGHSSIPGKDAQGVTGRRAFTLGSVRNVSGGE